MEQSKELLLNRIVKRTILQQIKGIEKYGTEIDSSLYNVREWYEHQQQELTDGLVYNEVMVDLVETVIDVLQAARVHNISQHTDDVDRYIKKAIGMLGGPE